MALKMWFSPWNFFHIDRSVRQATTGLTAALLHPRRISISVNVEVTLTNIEVAVGIVCSHF